MKAALALILIAPCLAQVLPRQMVPGRNSGRPGALNGVFETVQVDAVAVDPSGRPVTGLSARISKSCMMVGAQKVDKVEFVDTHERRTMVLVVDDLGLTLAHMRQVKWAIRKFVDQQMQPGDRVSILYKVPEARGRCSNSLRTGHCSLRPPKTCNSVRGPARNPAQRPKNRHWH